MTLPQQQQPYDEMFFTTGKVQQMLDRHYVINAGQRQIQALQATGCLLVPEPGDTVLLAEGDEEKAYIISVLNRSAKPARITLPEESIIAARGGNLALCADEQISLKSQEIYFQADKGIAEIRETDFTADKVELSVSRLRAIWSTMETRAERVFQRVTRLYRRIKTEDSRLEELHCSVENTCRIEARDISIEADERLRLDGERVEIG